MRKITFACYWAKDRAKSWSGTHLGVYKSMQSKFEVKDFDLNTKYSNFLTLVNKVSKRILKKDLLTIDKYNNRYAKNKLSKNEVVFSFAVSPYTEHTHNYVYQDLNYQYLLELQETDKEILSYSSFDNLSKRTMKRRVKREKKFYEHAKAIFFMNHWLKEKMVNDYGYAEDKVFCVGGGCNIDASLINPQKSGNKILFVGRDFDRKNGPLVVEAFKKAKEKRPDLELYIAGPNDLQIDYPGISCLGPCSYKDLVFYFNICDVFCMPSKFEAYGLVFAEALIFGLPCIGANAYEMPYFIEEGKNGYLLKNQDSNELANLMLSLLDNKEIKLNVLNNRQNYINNYSWDAVVERMKKIIDEKESLS